MPPVSLALIPGFDSVGMGEMLVLFAIILIVVGPKGLPKAARKLGAVMSTVRKAADEFKRQIMALDADETARPSTSNADAYEPGQPDPPASDTYIEMPDYDGPPPNYGPYDTSASGLENVDAASGEAGGGETPKPPPASAAPDGQASGAEA